MVRNTNVAWHAGNWYVNSHSIGLEHEGIAVQGARWYTEQLYRASARLVRYLALKYGVPLDRGHIIGHDNVPGPTPTAQTEMHWDPGPFWDWSHYMALAGAPFDSEPADSQAKIVTIAPDFQSNTPTVMYCFSSVDCRALKPQGTNFVYVRTAPRKNAPLYGDPAVHPRGQPGTRLVTDWGDKAVAGQEFYRIARINEWDQIFYGGRKVWFYDPDVSQVTAAGSGQLVTPRAGLRSVPVFGEAYPEAKAYPGWINPQRMVPLQYSVKQGQLYVVRDALRSDYFWSSGQRHHLVRGHKLFYEIFFNCRVAFVRASDVRQVPPHQPGKR